MKPCSDWCYDDATITLVIWRLNEQEENTSRKSWIIRGVLLKRPETTYNVHLVPGIIVATGHK